MAFVHLFDRRIVRRLKDSTFCGQTLLFNEVPVSGMGGLRVG